MTTRTRRRTRTKRTKKAGPKSRPQIQYGEPCLVIFRRSSGHDVDALAVLVEMNLAIHEGEQSPIAAGADVLTRRKLGAALADNDAAGGDEFAAITFDAEPFAGAVAPVTDAALTFFVCHNL